MNGQTGQRTHIWSNHITLIMYVRKEEFTQGMRVQDEEYYGDGFEEEDDWDPIAANKTYGGRFREGRNQEDNNMGSIKMKIPLF